jgi:hypothetical protein
MAQNTHMQGSADYPCFMLNLIQHLLKNPNWLENKHPFITWVTTYDSNTEILPMSILLKRG